MAIGAGFFVINACFYETSFYYAIFCSSGCAGVVIDGVLCGGGGGTIGAGGEPYYYG